ncbi:hypothetical protein [Nocardia salmonicida]|uniref:hypothetical protein n=1 Tax=Nocardia salmonicida TaxID=53431 RepID=UPI0037A34498
MTDERTARELAALEADVVAALAAAESVDMVGPVKSLEFLWGDFWLAPPSSVVPHVLYTVGLFLLKAENALHAVVTSD